MNIENLKPLEKNPFKSKGDKQIKLIAKSIESFEKMMTIRKIVIDENFEILGGNKRYFACRMIGMKEIPDAWIDQRTDLTEAEKKEFIVKDNSHWGSEWDNDLLKAWDVPVVDWGVEAYDWQDEKPDAKEDNYEIPDEIQTDIVPGDLFEIGVHRLLCGDSTDSEQVAKLMGGEKADMVFTDPPYNVSFNGRSGKFEIIKNDNLPENEFEELIDGFVSIVNILKPQNYYVWCNWKFYGILQNKLDFKACIVWAKNVFGIGRGYRHQHEFCLFNGKLDDGINNESDLWEVKKDSNYKHPTQKPIELAARALKNHKLNINVVDLFLGSGSTMVAAHQLNRRCFGMELDPKYCQVIVDRMKKLDPTLIIKKNGVVI